MGRESSFSLKIRPILIPASAIASNGVAMRDLIGRDEKTRGRGKRKVSTTNFRGEYVKTRYLRNELFLSSDEYCVKETLYVSGKLPIYPSPKPISTLTSHLGQNVGLGEG